MLKTKLMKYEKKIDNQLVRRNSSALTRELMNVAMFDGAANVTGQKQWHWRWWPNLKQHL